MHWTCWTKQNN